MQDYGGAVYVYTEAFSFLRNMVINMSTLFYIPTSLPGILELEMVCRRNADFICGFIWTGRQFNVYGRPISSQNTSCGIQPTFIRSLWCGFILPFLQFHVDRTRSRPQQ